DFLGQVQARRGELLAAALTIWRWGRQNAADVAPGRPLGGVEAWAAWVRDPPLALGGWGPGERVGRVEASDPPRRQGAELCEGWWSQHADGPIGVADLAETVRTVADPQGRGRQFLANYLAKLAGTRAAGFLLSRQEPAGRWGAATYALRRTGLNGTEATG